MGQTDRQTDTDVREKHRLVASCLRADQGLNLPHFGERGDALIG